MSWCRSSHCEFLVYQTLFCNHSNQFHYCKISPLKRIRLHFWTTKKLASVSVLYAWNIVFVCIVFAHLSFLSASSRLFSSSAVRCFFSSSACRCAFLNWSTSVRSTIWGEKWATELKRQCHETFNRETKAWKTVFASIEVKTSVLH